MLELQKPKIDLSWLLEFLECFFSNLVDMIYVGVKFKIQANLVHLHCLFGGAPTLIFLFNPL